MMDTEALEQRGDRLFQRLGYYGFMTLAGLGIHSTIGTLIFTYGFVRFVIVGVLVTRTVLALRSAVRAIPTPRRGRDARLGVASPVDPWGDDR